MVTTYKINEGNLIIELNCKEKTICKTKTPKPKYEQRNFLGRRNYNVETVKKITEKYQEFQYDGEEGYFVKKAYRN